MKKRSIITFLFLFSASISGLLNIAFAVPAAPVIFSIEQPDGAKLNARLTGDEWNNGISTIAGYSIHKDIDGFWYYISHYVNNTPVISRTRADKLPPSSVKRGVRPSRMHLRESGWKGRYKSSSSAPSPDTAPDNSYTAGPAAVQTSSVSVTERKVVFILSQFTDRAGTYSEASFSSLINNINDYYSSASYGHVILSPASESSGTANNGVIGWITLNYAHPDTGGSTDDRNRKLTRDAIIASNQYINYSSFDSNNDGYVDSDELAVVVVVAGYERSYSASYTPTVWGHSWALGWGGVNAPKVDGVWVGDYNGGRGGYAQFGEIHQSSTSDQHQATMGIMVHEIGHLIFGLPDLYDTDGSSEGIGTFGIMGAGSWGMASSDLYYGDTPVLPCAWSRKYLGWIDVTPGSGAASITAAGSDSATPLNTAYLLATTLPNEYFLVENRQPLGYDRGLQLWLGNDFGGLAIWHIDDDTISGKINLNTVNNSECYPGGPSCAGGHYGVALMQADGNWDLEKNINRGNRTDLWYPGNSEVFDAASVPDSDLYDGAPSIVSVTNISASGSTMTSVFAVQAYVLNVTKSGTGSGTVSSVPAGIACGTDCVEVYDVNTIVTLTATPSAESVFIGWSGDGDCFDGVVTMNANINCIAVFSVRQYQLNTSVNPAGGGSMSPDCSPGCLYDSGTLVVLTANENSGYFLSNWTNCDLPSNDICTETMDAADTVTANFQPCLQSVRIAGAPPVYHSTLQSAYDAAEDGAVIQTRIFEFTDDLIADRNISVLLEGGYNCNYSAVSGWTTFNGLMAVSDGMVTIGDYVFGN